MKIAKIEWQPGEFDPARFDILISFNDFYLAFLFGGRIVEFVSSSYIHSNDRVKWIQI